MSDHKYNEAGERTAPNGRVWTREMDSFMLLELTVQRQRLAALSETDLRQELADHGGPQAGTMSAILSRLDVAALVGARAALKAIDEKFGRRYADEG